MLHTTPYAETSVVAKVFTRELGVKSYLVKGVRQQGGRVKQNLFEPLCSLDMVVYDNHGSELNYVKELSPRHPARLSLPVANALRFFMTEVLYKTLREGEPMPALWDYVEEAQVELERVLSAQDGGQGIPGFCTHLPIRFLLTVARHLGIEPMDNYSPQKPLFDLQKGRFVGNPDNTVLIPTLSLMLHEYLSDPDSQPSVDLTWRRGLIDELIKYYQLHLSGFRNFYSHEILHAILK